MAIKTVIFDLDDTLLDTMGQLVLPATLEAYQAMKESGLKCTQEEFLKKRSQIRRTRPREDVFLKIAEAYAPQNAKIVAKAGAKAFLKRKINENIKPFPDTIEMLEKLKKRFTLFLVTLGDPETQKVKVEILKFSQFFDKVFYVDAQQDGSKKSIFSKILEITKAHPNEIVSLGNRIDIDVADARKLGMIGVLFKHGEYTLLEPETPFEKPDFAVKSLTEFEAWLN